MLVVYETGGRNMKRILALMLALVLTFGLVACTSMPIDPGYPEILPVLTEPADTEKPDTADHARPGIYLALCLMALAGAAVLLVNKKKYKG